MAGITQILRQLSGSLARGGTEIGGSRLRQIVRNATRPNTHARTIENLNRLQTGLHSPYEQLTSPIARGLTPDQWKARQLAQEVEGGSMQQILDLIRQDKGLIVSPAASNLRTPKFAMSDSGYGLIVPDSRLAMMMKSDDPAIAMLNDARIEGAIRSWMYGGGVTNEGMNAAHWASAKGAFWGNMRQNSGLSVDMLRQRMQANRPSLVLGGQQIPAGTSHMEFSDIMGDMGALKSHVFGVNPAFTTNPMTARPFEHDIYRVMKAGVDVRPGDTYSHINQFATTRDLSAPLSQLRNRPERFAVARQLAGQLGLLGLSGAMMNRQ